MPLIPRSLPAVATLCLVFTITPFQQSRALTPERVRDGDLVYVYIESTYEISGETCSRRFPDLAGSMREGLKAWRARNATTLVEMRRLHADLHAAARTSPPINHLLDPARLAQLARLWTDDELRALAGYLDDNARQFCEKRRADLDDDDQTRILFIRARETAGDLLKQKQRHTEEYERRQRQQP